MSGVLDGQSGEADVGGGQANWAGNYQYSTDRLFSAESVEQVVEFVKRHERLRVLGTRHCFNGIADSGHHLLSLGRMNRVVALDRAAQTVTVEGGMSYGQLCPYLDANGFALHNLASLPHISIAGACATATHGSGVGNGNLATAVCGLEVVMADGEVRTLGREKDGKTLLGAVVHLGSLGVVTKVTLDVEPAFAMRQDVYQSLPMVRLGEHLEEILSAGYSVSLFTDWGSESINEVWIKRQIENGMSVDAAPTFYDATLAARNLHPIAELDAENCTEQMGVAGPWYERLPHFRMGFTPSSGRELQSEYFVPRENAMEAIGAIARLSELIRPHLMISELRTIDADALWMSPCYQQASLAIHFTWKPDWESVRQVLPVIEKELSRIKARPHWGKLFTMLPAEIQSRYEKLAEFKALLREYDPDGKFCNEFVAANIFG